ncbi:MAG: hypothetical protein ACI4EA_03665 [Candidatus Ornithomonoglobus sp.]
MSEKRTQTKTITLGSGNLYYQEFDDSTPTRDEICTDAKLLGRISGGAAITYTPSYYEAKDDEGVVKKTIITDEEATLKSGIITWNGKTLGVLTSTARVKEADGYRTVKIGGAGNDNGKSYVICFHHKDKVDGDIWVMIVGKNQSGFELTFAKDKETTIDAEFKALPMDDEGTLIEYTEEMTTTA